MTHSLLFLLTLFAGCSGPAVAPTLTGSSIPVDSARVVADLRYLSSPTLAGRATGTAGNEAARAYIASQLRDAGVRPIAGEFRMPFVVPAAAGGIPGSNVVGYVPGTERPDRFIVITAHFDHLGRRGDEIYHGADDNASGTAALLEIGRYFAENRPRNSVILAALDAEEIGLLGARAFVADPPVPLASVVLNVNLDMVGRSDAGELYAAGTRHYPFLVGLVDRVAARSAIRLLRGHDGGDGGDDWTLLSDHAAFHEAGIPFLYFGVEDHEDYHRPTDTYENIDQAFFVEAVRTILDFTREADLGLDEIAAAAGRAR
jgi:Zn-dependent M28 family amino/carboxypeptidase